MEEQAIKSFKEKLDTQHQWPGIYVFKFIVPIDSLQEAKKLFPDFEITEKTSSKGNYISLTIKAPLASSDHVIAYYIKAKKIKGVISL